MKPNYFTIHKNKKPKRLFRKKNNPNPHTAMICLLGAIGARKVSDIQTDWIMNKEQKGLSILNTLLNTASAIIKEVKQMNYLEYKRTGKYKRINKNKYL